MAEIKSSADAGASAGGGKDDPVTDAYKNLLYKTEMTKGARYQAARRHGKRSTASIWSIIALSMYVFIITVFVNLDGKLVAHPFSDVLNILVISMSAFIIALSVMEHGKKHDLKAELFLRNAQRIGRLHDLVKLELDLGKCVPEAIETHTSEYAELVHDFADNHSEADYRTFRINIGKHKGQRLYSFWQIFKYSADCWSFAWLSFFVPLGILMGVVFFAMHKMP